MEEAGGGANLPGTVGRPPGTSRQAYRFRLLGRVQGVGFRPFVVRLAVRSAWPAGSRTLRMEW